MRISIEIPDQLLRQVEAKAGLEGRTVDEVTLQQFDALVAAGWVDAWRSLHPDAREYSWCNARSGNGFRLDHALLSPSLAGELASARYVHATRESKASDHSALLIELRTRTSPNIC
jgi:exonuclease III